MTKTGEHRISGEFNRLTLLNEKIFCLHRHLNSEHLKSKICINLHLVEEQKKFQLL